MDDEASAPRGADLAREALAAARASSAARRKAAGRTPMAGRGSAGNLRRRRWSGSGPDARDPQPLGATLRAWVATAGAGADLKKATLFAGWAKIVGPEVADHCSPVSLTEGELVVEAESTAWATQIRMLAPQLLKTDQRRGGGPHGDPDQGSRAGRAVLEVRLPARPRSRSTGHLRLSNRVVRRLGRFRRRSLAAISRPSFFQTAGPVPPPVHIR